MLLVDSLASTKSKQVEETFLFDENLKMAWRDCEPLAKKGVFVRDGAAVLKIKPNRKLQGSTPLWT